ncbi:MAG TPA: hypothetical protein VKU42_01030, partial [Candidatus Angelobacter sp.]|nr:hypothetical protein [Candidatus Angelobacter sp.]
LYPLVREFFPSSTDQQVHDILVNWTAFPFTEDVLILRMQLASAQSAPAEELKENEPLWGEL